MNIAKWTLSSHRLFTPRRCRRAVLASVALTLAACASMPDISTSLPERDKPEVEQRHEFSSRMAVNTCSTDGSGMALNSADYRVDEPLAQQWRNPGTPRSLNSQGRRLLPLSPGDRIEIRIHEGEEFSGEYLVNHDGNIELPYLAPVQVVGLDTEEVENRLRIMLVAQQMFLAHTLHISVRPLQWAPIMVSVSGAVFEPGRVLINDLIPAQTDDSKIRISGDYPTKRYLSEAIRAAAGARPDARVDKVLLIRDGWQQEINLAGIFSGQHTYDVPLIAGDQVIVPSAGCMQAELIRPSQITPKGIRVFISNLTNPASNNASAAVGKYSSSMPYGTRLHQAVVSGNCSGGTQFTNASRYVVLVGTNPISGESEIMKRNVEELLRNPDSDDINPYLLPNDTVSCYDSTIGNWRDIARAIVDVATPFSLF